MIAWQETLCRRADEGQAGPDRRGGACWAYIFRAAESGKNER